MQDFCFKKRENRYQKLITYSKFLYESFYKEEILIKLKVLEKRVDLYVSNVPQVYIFLHNFLIWKNSLIYPYVLFYTGDRYVIETDGLLIKGVDYNDAGTYTCRARVLETGSLEERDIKLEVR